MNNTKPLLKRVVAYIIDLTIILVVSSFISSFSFFNKELTKYQETYKTYETEYKNYVEIINLLNESYKDNELSEEEFDKFNEQKKYQEIISKRYDDKKLTKEEYEETYKEITEEFNKISNDYVYLLNKSNIANTIITLVCTLLYFGVLQFFLKGQTIGKKIFKLRVVSTKDKKLPIFTYIFRSLIINDILLNTIGTVFLVVANKQLYMQVNNIITKLVSIIEVIIIFMIITREDTRGLHDVLVGTKVISIAKKADNQEKTIKEEKHEIKNKSKTTKKSKKKIVEAEYEDKK